MNQKLKQPKKFTHFSLIKHEKQDIQKNNQKQENLKSKAQQKTKKIVKLHDKKVIKKKFQPSAIRLAAINQTFHKIESNANQMINKFDMDSQKFTKCLNYTGKVKCKCNRNIKYFCLKCMFKNPQLSFPKLKLPFNIRVIHHSSQKVNKSSIIPISLLSDEIFIQTYSSSKNQNNLLKNVNKNQTWILFPHKNSKKVSERKDLQIIKNVVILDCTWFQTDQLVSQLESEGFTNFVRLQDYQSLYWRYNHHSDRALSSAEALIYFLREYQRQSNLKQNQYDNLMFLYCLNLKIIEESYRKEGKDRSQQVQQQQRMQND